MNRIFWVSFTLALTFTIQSSIAQTFMTDSASIPEEEVLELFDLSLEDILNVGMVSASRKKQSAVDAPAYAYVFTDEQIEIRGFDNLLELINSIPEVEIQANSNPEYRNMVTLRGIPGAEKFLILLNGIRINPANGDFYTLGQNYSLVNAKRVEVILGPASALYGVDAFSGVINIITRNQEGEVFEGGFIKSNAGSFGTIDQSFLAGIVKDELKITVSGNIYHSEEPKYYEYYPVEYAWYTNQFEPNGNVIESTFFPEIYSVDYFEDQAGSRFVGEPISRAFEMPTDAYSTNVELTFKDINIGFYRNEETHSSAIGVNPKFTSYDRQARITNTMNVFYLRHTYVSPDKKWNLSSSFEQNYFEIDPMSHFASSATRWQRGYIYSYSQSSKISEQFQTDINTKWNLTFGFNYENLSSLPRTAPSPSPFDPNQPLTIQDIYYMGAGGYPNYSTSETFSDSLAVEQLFYPLKFQNIGSYGQINWQPSYAWNFTLGTRFDYNTRYGSSINPRIGIVVKPIKKLTMKALFGTAFLAPSPAKSFLQAGTIYSIDTEANEIYADYFRFPNENLQPERSYTMESSINYFFTSNFSISGNGYYTLVENLINPYGEVTEKPAGLDNVFATKEESSVNEGFSDFYGLSARLNYLYSRSKFQMNVFASGSMIEGFSFSEDQDGEDVNFSWLNYQSFFTVKSGLDIKLGRFSSSFQLIHKTPSTSNVRSVSYNFDLIGNQNLDYTLINMNTRFELFKGKKLSGTLRLKITNLLDNRYYNVYVGNEEGMPRTPQDPRKIVGGIEIKF